MTVIAALRLEGVPALIGDFLLIDSRTDLQHFPLPTRQNVQDPVGQPLPHRIHGMERKCLIINDRFIIGFTGHVPAAKMLFGALERKFAKQPEDPTLIQIDETLESLKAEINRRKYTATIVGWTVRARPRCFSWSPTPDSKTQSVQEAIVGAGAIKFRAALTDYDRAGKSMSVVTAYDKATLRGINIVGRVLSDELVSGHNLITGYGYGAEIALHTGTRFTFVSKIGYTFWNIRLNNNGIMLLQPSGVIGVYENKGRYALLNIIQCRSDENGIMADNSYLAGLTPLHDNMGLILSRGDEPDMICDFYFIGLAGQDTRTGRMAMLRVSCCAKDLSLFKVEQTNPGKFLFHLNMGEVAAMVQTVFPDAKW
jgi:hypothetical protein